MELEKGSCEMNYPRTLAAIATLGVMAHLPRAAHAQYSYSFHYDNGRFAYSQGWVLGRNGYAGGFSVRTPTHRHSSSFSYGGRSYSSSFHDSRPGFRYDHGYFIGPDGYWRRRHHWR